MYVQSRGGEKESRSMTERGVFQNYLPLNQNNVNLLPLKSESMTCATIDTVSVNGKQGRDVDGQMQNWTQQ
jgi:hypothetical protein